MTSPRVELLYWPGCPSSQEALADVRRALAELGHPELEVAMRRIDDDAQAQETGFVGSPTVRVDGVDAFPPEGDERPGLACRVYWLPDGRPSPLPDPSALRASLARLLANEAQAT